MARIIVELGSGNTCRNDARRLVRMIDQVIKRDTKKHEIVFKMQLFKKAGENLALKRHIFDYALYYARERGYEMSASVFDVDSLDHLLSRSPVFVKLACLPELHYLASAVPESIPVYASFPGEPGPLPSNVYPLCCVRQYPARAEDYAAAFSPGRLAMGISDHVPGFALWHTYHPDVWEKHVVDVREEGNPDAGPFAATIGELGKII